MCEAIEEMLNEREEIGQKQGIEIGELRMLMRLVREGDLKIERAAEKANMSPEQFKQAMVRAAEMN